MVRLVVPHAQSTVPTEPYGDSAAAVKSAPFAFATSLSATPSRDANASSHSVERFTAILPPVRENDKRGPAAGS